MAEHRIKSTGSRSIPGDYMQLNQIIQGDCLEAMRLLPDNSVDSFVSDPPAGIAFMGKKWDTDKGGRKQWCAYMEERFAEALRVCKPGAHGLVWALPRTSHWTATALEDAGWEVRDIVTHIQSQGFPKSQNIGKAIDRKFGGSEAQQWDGWGSALKPASENWFLVQKPVDAVGYCVTIKENISNLESGICGSIANSAGKNSKRILQLLSEVKENFAAENAVIRQGDGAEPQTQTGLEGDSLQRMDMSEYESMGTTCLSTVKSWKSILEEVLRLKSMFTIEMEIDLTTDLKTLSCWISRITPELIIEAVLTHGGERKTVLYVDSLFSGLYRRLKDIQTLSALEPVISQVDLLNLSEVRLPMVEAEQTEALFPASEHWVLVRKPIEGTIADNVLTHGVGGINVDGCRVESTLDDPNVRLNSSRRPNKIRSATYGGFVSDDKNGAGSDWAEGGRFPANLVLSHSHDCDTDGCADGCPVKALDDQTAGARASKVSGKGCSQGPRAMWGNTRAESYTPIKTYEQSNAELTQNASRFFPNFYYCPKASTSDRSHKGQVQNNHPTVKNRELMRWLCRLVTPPGGIVLDCFAGSGSTAIACLEEGFRYILIEQDAESVQTANDRVNVWLKENQPQPTIEDRLTWLETKVEAIDKRTRKQTPGQLNLFGDVG